MDPETWRTIANIAVALSTLISAGSAILVLVLRRSFASSDQIAALHTRVSVIEVAVSPTTLSDIRDRLGQLDGEIKGLRATVEAIQRDHQYHRKALDTIQNFLLEHR